MKTKTLLKKVLKFNEDLEAYYRASDDRTLPNIDSTIIGYEEFEGYEVSGDERGFTAQADGFTWVVKEVTEVVDGEVYTYTQNEDDLLESLKYDRRRLNKAWRIWRSENPDAELERDDEE